MQGLGVYVAAKYAVVGLSETLQRDLSQYGIGVSVLCPMIVLRNPPRTRTAEDHQREEQMRHAVQSGRVTADMVAEMVLEGIKQERFYIFTHPRIKAAIHSRMDDVLNERRPTDTSKPSKD